MRQGGGLYAESQPQNTGRVPEQRHAALLLPRRQGLVQEERNRAGVGTGIQGYRQGAGKRMKIPFSDFLRTCAGCGH